MADYFNIENANYSSDLSSSLSTLLSSSSLCDCTLVCEDGQLSAHKVILAATSTFFSSVFKQNPHNHPLIYLRGVKIGQVQSVLEFVYNGATSVAEEDVSSFIAVANDLQIRGLREKQEDIEDRMKEGKELVADNNEVENRVFIHPDPLYCTTPTPVEESAMDDEVENQIDKSAHLIKEEDLTETTTQAAKISKSETNIHPNMNRKANTIKIKVNTDKTFTPIRNVTENREHTSFRAKSKQAPFTCPACKARIISSFLLKHHMEAKRESQCEKCNLYFNSCKSLTDHKKGRCREKSHSKLIDQL